MGVSEIQAAVIAELRKIPGVWQVPDSPPAQLTDDVTLLVYTRARSSVPGAHRGSRGGAVINCRDDVIIEAHFLLAEDQLAVYMSYGKSLFDQVLETIWAAAQRNQFAGTIEGMISLNTDQEGWLGWSDQSTYGFRLVADVAHARHIVAGVVPDGH